jgi:hypothetical protein
MASDIYVQEPCETIGETEPLIVTQIIQDDYLFFDYYLNFGREHANKVCGGRVWPVVWLKGFFTPMPSFYMYLIDATLYDDGERVITIGVAHWLLGIYAEIEMTFKVYPERYDLNASRIFLPTVTFQQYGYKFEYKERGGMPQRDAIVFVNNVVDGVVEYTEVKCAELDYDIYNRERIQSDLRGYCKEKGVLLSARLFQVWVHKLEFTALLLQPLYR